MVIRKRWPLALKLSLVMTTLIAVVVVAITLLSLRREQTSFETELEQQADTLLDSLTAAASNTLLRLQIPTLDALMQNLGATPSIIGGRAFDASGRLIARSFSDTASSTPTADPWGERLVNSDVTVFNWQSDRLVAGRAVDSAGQRIGAFSVELSTAPLAARMNTMRNEGFMEALLASLVGALVSLLLSRSLTEPLEFAAARRRST